MTPPSQSLRQVLLSVAHTQLLAQSQLAITYDAQALGTMGFDAAFGAIVIAAKSHAYIWLGSLGLLACSVVYSWLALQTAGAEETGPDVKDVLLDRGTWTDDQLEVQVIEDLQHDVHANAGNLAAKGGRVQFALSLLLGALVLELVAQL